MDSKLLFAGSDYVIEEVYEILDRHWSEITKDERYFIEGSLTGEERNKKYTAVYIGSMLRYISRPFLVPRMKFLGLQYTRELFSVGPNTISEHWRTLTQY